VTNHKLDTETLSILLRSLLKSNVGRGSAGHSLVRPRTALTRSSLFIQPSESSFEAHLMSSPPDPSSPLLHSLQVKVLENAIENLASYPITRYQRSFGEIPPPPDLLLLPDPFPRCSASSMASMSLVTTRVLISGATPFCVTLRRINPGLGIGNGANSSSWTLPMSWRRSGRPLVFVKTN